LQCVSQPKIAKIFTKLPYFKGSRSFKAINVDISKKPVPSACYDKQRFVPMCNHFTLDKPIAAE